MESELGDLAGSFQQWSEHLNNQKQLLKTEIDRLKTFQQDHNALEKQLKTLPDKTTRSAMIPIGSLAFMPGKFIHTNEITVYLGSNYYVERSAKQALEILDRRKQVVKDNLKLLEEQLEGLSSKEEAKFGAFPSSEMGVNEEGLPIMEIREELPEDTSDQQQPSASQPEPAKPVSNSVKENVVSDEKPVSNDNNEHMKDVMALLKQLDGEEDDEEDHVEQEKSLRERIMEYAKEESDEEDSDDDDELDDRYDTEIADNLFDHFDDDEEYAIQGVVEQEDATIHEENDDESQSETSPAVSNIIETTVQETPAVSDSSKEKLEADQQKVQPATQVPSSSISSEPVSTPKKVSRFKAARNQDRIHTSETTNESHQPSTKEQQIPAVKPVTSSPTAPKKVSKFKAARQQHVENVIPSIETSDTNASSSKAPQKNPERGIPKVQPAKQQQQHSTPQMISTSEQSTASIQKRGIPVVESAGTKKKTSRFKAARQQARENKTIVESSSSSATKSNSTPAKDDNGKRRVTWDEVATVQEHDRSAAPSEATSTDTYTSPVKQESNNATTTTLPHVIRSPADIFKVVKAQRQILLDDGYPSLDTGEDQFDESESTIVTMDELRHSANLGKQELWQLKVEPENPLLYNHHQMPQEQNSLPKMPKTKLDTNIMKGAVLEREIEAVDLEQVEADMDLREVTSSYHRKKYDIVAAMGGYTFESKDTYEVVDEELPLPSVQEKKKSKPEPEEKPKKMSRFKAARLAKLDRQEE